MLAMQAAALLLAQAEVPSPPVGAAGDAIELGIGAGAVDGWSVLEATTAPHARVPGGGGAVELSGGWRAAPHLAIGVWGFGAQLSETPALPSTAGAYAAGAGAEGTWHFRPGATDADPWVSLGSGWRALWLTFLSDGTTAQHGIELARVRVGVDLRATPGIALGPVVGASVATVVTEEVQGGPWHLVPATRLDTFVFAGVRATVDVPLHRRPPGE
jgi:hypothetical protein